MQTIGSDDAGFSVGLDIGQNVIQVVGWGFWDQEVASSFGRLVIEACEFAPSGATVSMDMSRLKPMREEGQKAFGSALAVLKGSRIARVSVITASQLTKLQLMRIAREAAPKDRVQFI